MYQNETIIVLLKKYLSGTLTPQEFEKLEEWKKYRTENEGLFNRINQDRLLAKDLQLYWELWNTFDANDREQRIIDKTINKIKSRKQANNEHIPDHRLPSYKPLKRIIYAAAIILIAFIVGIAINIHNKGKPQAGHSITLHDVLPGGNEATLMLADGTIVDLQADQSGIIIGDNITYLDGKTILPFKKNNTSAAENLVIKTPLGGQYHIVLPDGTAVWLNANSTLTYSSKFSISERMVHLEGEAYFKVKRLENKNKLTPFSVFSDGQEIRVLGTEFNVLAYQDEDHTKTTLINGSIEVINLATHHLTQVSPGQQASVSGTETLIGTVDVNKEIAWKNGKFSFDNKTFDQIMTEMARWYNIKVEYQNGIPSDRFIGDAYKTDKLSTVLRFLESSDIQYRIESTETNTPKLIIYQSN